MRGNPKRRPSFGRPRGARGLDQFDTPPAAIGPLWEHELLLVGVEAVAEPFCGKGNLVTAMRAHGLTVFASDIEDRGCPDSRVLDFRAMTRRPCDVLISNPPYADAMGHIEHALEALQFRVAALLLDAAFLFTRERYERLHKPGHLRRVHVLAERLQNMHDAAHLLAGGKKSSQPRMHAWFVFDRDYCGPATINPVSIRQPTERMPWSNGYHPERGEGGVPSRCERCGISYQALRSTSRFCSPACRQRAHHQRLSVTLSVTEEPP